MVWWHAVRDEGGVRCGRNSDWYCGCGRCSRFVVDIISLRTGSGIERVCGRRSRCCSR